MSSAFAVPHLVLAASLLATIEWARSAGKRFFEFFTAEIRNPKTRCACGRAAGEFFSWCEGRELIELWHIESKRSTSQSRSS